MKLALVLFLAGVVSAAHWNKYVEMVSEEVDSEEHGVTAGKRSTSCKCGWANKATSRIVGGKETEVNQFPFATLLRLKSQWGVWSYCGGSIISEYHILTAAHCTYDIRIDNIHVVIGEHNRQTSRETDATIGMTVRSKVDHENYDPDSDINDISLLELDRKITFTSKVGPVCLPTPNEELNLINKYVKVMGWGRIKSEGLGSDWLRQTNLRVIPLDICNQAFYGIINTSNPTQLCTFSKGKDTCQGDSGGPVVYVDPDTNRYTLVGLVSYGRGCAEETPGVNTKVAAYLDWIQKNMKRTNPKGITCAKV